MNTEERPWISLHSQQHPKGKVEERNNLSPFQRDRSNNKIHPFKTDHRIIIPMTNNANQGKFRYNERDLKTEKYYPLQKQSRSLMKQDVLRDSSYTYKTYSSIIKLSDPYEVVQNNSNFQGSRTPGRVVLNDEFKGSLFPNCNINALARREYKLPDTPIVYGSASSRLERLKEQLSDSSFNKYQLPSSAWPEKSPEKKWQTQFLEPRNRIDDVDDHSRPFIGPSFISTSLNSRKSVIPGSGISRVMNLDLISEPFSSNIVSEPLKRLTHPKEYVKPYFVKDYYHSKDPYKSKIFVSKCRDSFPETAQNDCSQFQSSSERKLSDNSHFSNYSSAFHNTRKSFLNTYISASTSNTSKNNVLAKRVFHDEEKNRLIAERGCVPQPAQNLFLKPERTSYSQTKVFTQFVTHPKPGESCKNKGSDNYSIYSVEAGRKLPYEGQVLCNSKTPAMDRLQRCRFTLSQANPLKKQLGGGSHFSNLKYSNIRSLHSASDEPFSGKSCVTETAVNSLRSNISDIEKNLVKRPSIEDIPLNYSALKNNAKDVETYFNRREVRSAVSDLSEQKFVRDYNHKRVPDHSEKNLQNLHDNGKMYKLCQQTEVNKSEMSLKSKFDGGSSLKKNTFQSLSGSSKYEHQISYPYESSYHQDEEQCSTITQRKNIKSGCAVEQQFERSYVKPCTNKIECTDHFDSATETTFVNTLSNSATQGEKKLPSEKFSRKVEKQKSHPSKGGITKINRKVQKQLKTAAPRSLHLTAPCVLPKSFEFTIQSKHMLTETNKTPYTITVEEEKMDWDPIEPEKVVLHVEELRKEGGLQNDINPELINLCRKDIEITIQWFVVLDTNVLLSNLDFVCQLRDIEDRELGMPTLFIPWVVLQELDGLKSTKKKLALQYYARKAVNFLFDNLFISHPRVRGQPKSEADKHESLEPDDSILQCSLNLQKLSTKVLLLTNDHNLFNKATVSGVECCSAAKLVQKLGSCTSSKSTSSVSGVTNKSDLPIPSTVETLKQCLGHVLEEVLRTEMVLAYDTKWSKIVARKPPWTLNDVLFCFLKHWIAVFHMVFPAAARELIEKIRVFINCEVDEISLENVENIVKTCISLMHLISSLSYKQYVDNALSTMNMLLQTLEEHKKLNAIHSLSTSDTSLDVVRRSEAASNFSSTTKFITSNFATENGEHINYTGSITNSRRCDGITSGSGSKIEANEDCLSLFTSTFSDGTPKTKPTDTNCWIEKRAELVHKYLNTIFEKVVWYCGMLCDVMGIDPCVQYQRPEPFPSMETLNQNILSYIKCVSSLLHCFQGILSKQPSDLQENSGVLLSFYSTIKYSITDVDAFDESLLPRHVLDYCLQSDTRHVLEVGKKQFEQLQAVLNQALNFFMVQNQSRTPLPSL